MELRALTWNLFHGRDFPPDPSLFSARSRLLRITERNATHAQVNRDLFAEFASTLAGLGATVVRPARRNEPDQRIRELGDASVPFGFDVHALVHDDDAPALEAALHNHFQAKRINKVNLRKEFFRVSMDEIGEACAKLGCTIRLTKLAEAREYRATLALEAKASG